MRLAAIDIGSNGARLLIKNFRTAQDGSQQISRVMYMRVPLRLGSDVFTLGKISKERTLMMKHMLKAFYQLMKLNQVDDYRACATSAMRDAGNGKKVLEKLRKATDINIEIINGREEARLLCNNIVENIGSAKGNYAYIDVGGGSTEISLLHDGVLTHSHSYNIGTLRMLGGMVSKDAIRQMKDDLTRFAREMPGMRMIGSGGNINKLFKLTDSDKQTRMVPVGEIKSVYESLKNLSVEERIEQYGLKVDRADVIVPASEIFLLVAEALGCEVAYTSTSGVVREEPYPARPLDELLAWADIVSVHCPLTDRTRGLIGARELALMKPSALVINVARGGIVDEAALAAALDAGRLAGAALDVFVHEPLEPGNPLLAVREPDRLLLSPHNAWSPVEAVEVLVGCIARNIRENWKNN